MGEVSVKVELRNVADMMTSGAGKAGQRIRHHEMTAVVDTGAVMLALPQDVVEKLGLQFVRNAVVSYADERREELKVMGAVNITIGDRQMMTECLMLPPTAEALIGQVVLETLDLLVDCQRQTLVPRPESPILASSKLK